MIEYVIFDANIPILSELVQLRQENKARFETAPRSRMPAQRFRRLIYLEISGQIVDTEGELIRPSEWREADGRYGVGDYVTRDGTDVHRVVALNGPDADSGDFICIKAPEPYEDGKRWIEVGETEFNLTRRYSPISPQDVANDLRL